MTRSRILLALVVLAVLAAAPAGHAAATPNHRLGAPELHPGSTGPDVAALQWLLSGHKPYALSKIKPTLKTYDKGISGGASSRTWTGVRDMKFRIGYPGVGQCTAKDITPHGAHWKSSTAGPYFFALLLGHKHPPTCWTALASKRLAEAARVKAQAATPAAIRIMKLELTQLGARESWGPNWGPQVQKYQTATGQYHAAWCVSFQQWSWLNAGVGTFANRTASVDYVTEWARYHGYLNAKAKPGALVDWYHDRSHEGFIIKTYPAGFDTIEGNTTDTVAVRHYTWASARLHYFIWDPRVVHA